MYSTPAKEQQPQLQGQMPAQSAQRGLKTGTGRRIMRNRSWTPETSLEHARWIQQENQRLQEAQDLVRGRDQTVKQIVDLRNSTPNGGGPSNSKRAREPLGDVTNSAEDDDNNDIIYDSDNQSATKGSLRTRSVDELRMMYAGGSMVLPEHEFQQRLKAARPPASPGTLRHAYSSPSLFSQHQHRMMANHGSSGNSNGNTAALDERFASMSLARTPTPKVPVLALPHEETKEQDRVGNGNGIGNDEGPPEYEDTIIITIPATHRGEQPQVITEEFYPFSPDLKGQRGELDCRTARVLTSRSSQHTARRMGNADSPNASQPQDKENTPPAQVNSPMQKPLKDSGKNSAKGSARAKGSNENRENDAPAPSFRTSLRHILFF
jgi:hypothetical protein